MDKAETVVKTIVGMKQEVEISRSEISKIVEQAKVPLEPATAWALMLMAIDILNQHKWTKENILATVNVML